MSLFKKKPIYTIGEEVRFNLMWYTIVDFNPTTNRYTLKNSNETIYAKGKEIDMSRAEYEELQNLFNGN